MDLKITGVFVIHFQQLCRLLRLSRASRIADGTANFLQFQTKQYKFYLSFLNLKLGHTVLKTRNFLQYLPQLLLELRNVCSGSLLLSPVFRFSNL